MDLKYFLDERREPGAALLAQLAKNWKTVDQVFFLGEVS